MAYEAVPELAVAGPRWVWVHQDEDADPPPVFLRTDSAGSSSETDLSDTGSSCPSDAADQGADTGYDMRDREMNRRRCEWYERMRALRESLRASKPPRPLSEGPSIRTLARRGAAE